MDPPQQYLFQTEQVPRVHESGPFQRTLYLPQTYEGVLVNISRHFYFHTGMVYLIKRNQLISNIVVTITMNLYIRVY